LSALKALGAASNAFFHDPATGTILLKVFDNAALLAAKVDF
jgi:hypothetical protein